MALIYNQKACLCVYRSFGLVCCLSLSLFSFSFSLHLSSTIMPLASIKRHTTSFSGDINTTSLHLAWHVAALSCAADTLAGFMCSACRVKCNFLHSYLEFKTEGKALYWYKYECRLDKAMHRHNITKWQKRNIHSNNKLYIYIYIYIYIVFKLYCLIPYSSRLSYPGPLYMATGPPIPKITIQGYISMHKISENVFYHKY